MRVGQHVIPSSSHTKYLGVVIDQDLKWRGQINNILQKLGNAARILYRVKHFVNKPFLVKLYYSFVYPHLKYGIIAWGNTNKTILNKLQVSQNKIIRSINFKNLSDHVNMSALFKSMNLLKLNDIYNLEMAKFMYSFHHNKLPENFDCYFKAAKNQHTYSTRSITNQNYYLERFNLHSGQTSCSYAGVKIWNQIPLKIKNLSKHQFSKHFRNHLINMY